MKRISMRKHPQDDVQEEPHGLKMISTNHDPEETANDQGRDFSEIIKALCTTETYLDKPPPYASVEHQPEQNGHIASPVTLEQAPNSPQLVGQQVDSSKIGAMELSSALSLLSETLNSCETPDSRGPSVEFNNPLKRFRSPHFSVTRFSSPDPSTNSESTLPETDWEIFAPVNHENHQTHKDIRIPTPSTPPPDYLQDICITKSRPKTLKDTPGKVISITLLPDEDQQHRSSTMSQEQSKMSNEPLTIGEIYDLVRTHGGTFMDYVTETAEEMLLRARSEVIKRRGTLDNIVSRHACEGKDYHDLDMLSCWINCETYHWEPERCIPPLLCTLNNYTEAFDYCAKDPWERGCPYIETEAQCPSWVECSVCKVPYDDLGFGDDPEYLEAGSVEVVTNEYGVVVATHVEYAEEEAINDYGVVVVEEDVADEATDEEDIYAAPSVDDQDGVVATSSDGFVLCSSANSETSDDGLFLMDGDDLVEFQIRQSENMQKSLEVLQTCVSDLDGKLRQKDQALEAQTQISEALIKGLESIIHNTDAQEAEVKENQTHGKGKQPEILEAILQHFETEWEMEKSATLDIPSVGTVRHELNMARARHEARWKEIDGLGDSLYGSEAWKGIVRDYKPVPKLRAEQSDDMDLLVRSPAEKLLSEILPAMANQAGSSKHVGPSKSVGSS